MNIYIIRHGQTDWNVEAKAQGQADIELNEEGKRQAREIAQNLCNEKIDIIITSPLKRAKKTAEIINEKMNVPLIIKEGITERDLGELEGKRRGEYNRQEFWDYKQNKQYIKAEDVQSFFKRVYKCLDEIKLEHKDKNVLLVTHGGVNIPLSYYFNNVAPEDENPYYSGINNCEVRKYELKD